MKLDVCSPVLFPLIALSLVACQPGGGSGSNSGPQVESFHTQVITFTSDDSAMDMDLRIRFEVSDPDGFDDLNTAILFFPNGENYNISIPDRKSESNGEYYFYTYFNLTDFPLVDGQRQFPMTDYSVLIQDFSGNKTTYDFSLLDAQGVTVPDGTLMVHPNDFSAAGGSGGDYRSAMGIPVINDVVFTSDTVDVTLTVEDERTKELEFFFEDQEGETVAYFWEKNATNINTSGTKTYSIPIGELHFHEGYSSTDEIDSLIVAADDNGKFKEGAFQYASQLVAQSPSYPIN